MEIDSGKIIVTILILVALLIVAYLFWVLGGKKFYRSYIYKHTVYPAIIRKVDEIVTNKRAKRYIIAWLDRAGLIHYQLGDIDFNANYEKAISEIVEKVKREIEEEAEAKLNIEYYEYQSRNRKNTE